ncbi:hypothetical protein ABFS83_08G244600 [Erythranthe nasuta]
MEFSLKHHNRGRNVYEPSDTETDWPDSPRRQIRQQPGITGFDHTRNNKSPLTRMPSSTMLQMDPPFSGPARRKSSRSPYKPRVDGGNNVCLFSQSERRLVSPDNNRENLSPFSISERRRFISPYRQNNNHDSSKPIDAFNNSSKRGASAPRARRRERGQPIDRFPSVGEMNEMVANAQISRVLSGHVQNFDSTDSISPGDIFFSREYPGFQNAASTKNTRVDPTRFVSRNPGSNHRNSSFAESRQSRVSNSSGKTSDSTKKFIENRRKSQGDAWFSCLKKGSCKTSHHKSSEKERTFDEASFIEKAIVVESLRPFWADKHQPASLIGFNCHKQEALLLQELATSEIFPHILLKGPHGSGKKALTMALLREIYGDPVWNISHNLRYFHILESKPTQVVVPVTSSPHHVELNVHSEPKAAFALTALVKQISRDYAVAPEISTVNTKSDSKVLVLYDVDKATENVQHLIKWIMDGYSDSCKLIICCEDDLDVLESVKNRCKVVTVEAPATHEVMEVLNQIAKKEGFELSTRFAANIANKSKQNLRRAIMALEACKAHNYPFADDQPIPLGWEEALVGLAADILADPLPKRLFIIRGKIQKLLSDFVHPKLILLKLVEQFLKGIEASLKRELYYWYAYYDKRLPTGTSALLKLEEFVVKFMSIYRKSSSNRQLS